MTYPRNPLFSFYSDVQSSAATLAKAFKIDGPVITKLDELIVAVKNHSDHDDKHESEEYREWHIVSHFLLPAFDHTGEILNSGTTKYPRFNLLAWVYNEYDLRHICQVAECKPDHLEKVLTVYTDLIGFKRWPAHIEETVKIVRRAAWHMCRAHKRGMEQSEAS